jgi:hypothetical protein
MAIIQNNLLPKVKDMENATRIYGKDLGSIQGKTVRFRPDAVTTDYIEVTPDIMTLHQDITIAVDVMHIDGIQFLITTSRNIQFTTVNRLESKEWGAPAASLERVILANAINHISSSDPFLHSIEWERSYTLGFFVIKYWKT